MKSAGTIVPATETDPFDRESWIQVINDHPNLVQEQPRSGIPNPFNPGETMTIHPDPACANLVVDGEIIGVFAWAMNEETLINVDGNLRDVASWADNFAKLLGGQFIPDQ
jgi:hypothetical protein